MDLRTGGRCSTPTTARSRAYCIEHCIPRSYDSWSMREYVPCGLTNSICAINNRIVLGHRLRDTFAPQFSNNNYHPKSIPVENNVFSRHWTWQLGWLCREGLLDGLVWASQPWEVVSTANLLRNKPDIANKYKGKSEKVLTGDHLGSAMVLQASSTERNRSGGTGYAATGRSASAPV